MPGSLGGKPFLDVKSLFDDSRNRRLSTLPFFGKANAFRCPLGEVPGQGHLLMSFKDLSALDASGEHDLIFKGLGQEVTAKSLTITKAEKIVPGRDSADTGIYLVTVQDERIHKARVPIDAAFNLLDADGEYHDDTTSGGTPYTWDQIGSALWTAVGGLGAWPGLPFTPHGTPEQFDYYGSFAWAALNDFLKRCTCAVKSDPRTKTYTVVRLGATDAAATAAATALDQAKDRLWDARALALPLATVPASVRVRFRRYPAPDDGNSPFYHVTTATGVAGAKAGTVETIDDDLHADGDTGTPSNSAALTARAAERTTDWARRRQNSDRPLLRQYRGVRPDVLSIVGATAWEWCVRDLGDGPITEVAAVPGEEWELKAAVPVAASDPVPATSSGCSSSGLAWVLGKPALIYEDAEADPPLLARMFAAALRNGTGLCACLADQGDSALGRYLADPDDATAMDPQEGDTPYRMKYNLDSDGTWVGLFTFEGCCGACFTLKVNLDLTKPTLPGMVIGTAVVVSGSATQCKTDASSTFTLYAGCGEREGVAVLHAFSEAVCDWPPTEETDRCSPAFDIHIKCVECDAENAGCDSCAEKVGPPWYKAVVGSATVWLLADGDCSCTWTEACSGAVLTIGATTKTLVYNSNTYTFDTNTATPGCDLPPTCFAADTLPWTSGPAGSGSAVLTPVFCEAATDVSEPCTEEAVDLEATISMAGCAVQTLPMPYDPESGYTAGPFVFGGCVGCLPALEGYTLALSCSPSACGYSWAVTLEAPTGSGGTISFTVHSTRPVHITFSGTLECSSTGEGAPFVYTAFTGVISQVGGTPFWCVDAVCTQSATEPAGTLVTGPFATEAECERACACQGGGMMMAAVVEGESPPISAAAVVPRVTASRGAQRYVPLPQVPCAYLGEKIRGCTSCGNKDARHVFACDHPSNERGEATRGDTRSDLAPWTCGSCPHYLSPAAGG